MLATRKSIIELEQSPFPNQLKPDRSDSWAIVFSALRRTLFLITLCTTRHMVNQDLVDIKFCSRNMLQNWSIPKPPLPHEIHTLAQDCKAWKYMEVDCRHHWEPPWPPQPSWERYCWTEIGVGLSWNSYQVIFQLLKCSSLSLLPTKKYIFCTQIEKALSNKGKSNDELSVMGSKAKEALKLFTFNSTGHVLLALTCTGSVFILSDDTTFWGKWVLF